MSARGNSARDALRSRADALRSRRIPFVAATVVRAIKPTSARAGDRALVLPDGAIEGFVGGSCAESSVRLHAMRVLRAREPVMLRIVPGNPGDLGPAQGGPGPAEQTSDGLVTVRNPCASGGMLEIFLEGVFPPPLVQVWGDAPIARALRGVGDALGYDVRPAGGPGEPFPPDVAAVIVASHGRDEEPLLTAALRAAVPYVGLVASRRRGSQVAAALDVHRSDLERLHTPAGLDIGARTPGEVALSIFAEIIAKRQQPSPSPMPGGGAVVGQSPITVGSRAGRPGGATVGRPGPAVGADAESPADAVLGEMGGPTGVTPPAAGAGPAGEAAGAAAPAPGLGEPAEATDPVCGMTVAATGATPQMAHDGRVWFFCGPGCRQAFADNPSRYQ